MANKPGKPIYIGKPKPRPKPGDKVMKPLPVKSGKPTTKPAKPGDKVMKPLPVKPGLGSKDPKKLVELKKKMGK